METIPSLAVHFLIGVNFLLGKILGEHAQTVTSRMTVPQPIAFRQIVYGGLRAAGVLTHNDPSSIPPPTYVEEA
jgi:hypothetical protein